MAEGAPDPAGERGDIGRGRPMEGWPQQHGSIGGYDPVDQFRYATPTQSGQQFGGWQYQQGHSMHQAGMTDQSTRHAYSNDYNHNHFVPIGTQPWSGYSSMQPLPGLQQHQQQGYYAQVSHPVLGQPRMRMQGLPGWQSTPANAPAVAQQDAPGGGSPLREQGDDAASEGSAGGSIAGSFSSLGLRIHPDGAFRSPGLIEAEMQALTSAMMDIELGPAKAALQTRLVKLSMEYATSAAATEKG